MKPLSPSAIRRWPVVAAICVLPLIMLVAMVTGTAQGTLATGDVPASLDGTLDSHGVTMDPHAWTQGGEPGAGVTYTLRVTNTGTITDSFALAMSDNRWPTDMLIYKEGSVLVGTVILPQLAPSQGEQVQIVAHIPYTATGRDSDVVTVRAVSVGDPVYSSTATLTTTVKSHSVKLDPPVTLLRDPHALVTHTVHVTNTGNISDTFDFSSMTPAGWLQSELGVRQMSIEPGSSQPVMVTFTVGANVVSGTTYPVFITATLHNNSSVSDTTSIMITAKSHKVYLPVVLNNWPPRWSQGGLADQTVYQISVCGNDPDRLYAGTISSGVHRSTNAGQTWSPTALGNELVRGVAVNPQNCNEAYAAVWGQGVRKTTSGGITWETRLTLLDIYAVAIDPRPNFSQTVYIGTQSTGVYVSTNGGDSWAVTALTDAIVPALTVAADGTVYVATWGKGIYRLQGGSATQLGILTDAASRVFAVAVDPASTDVLYAATYGGLYRSSNGGSNWNLVLAGQTYSAIVDPADSQIVYAGVGNSGVWHSRDGGQSFGLFADGMTPNLTVRSVVIGPATSGYIHAGTTGGAWRFPR